jgi:hypothetical protein
MTIFFFGFSTITAPEIYGYSNIIIGSPQLLTLHHWSKNNPQKIWLDESDSYSSTTFFFSYAIEPMQYIKILFSKEV